MSVQALNTPSLDPGSGEPSTVLRLVSSHDRADTARIGVVVLYETEFRNMARLAYLLCGDTHRADDLAHDAFVRLYEHWDRVDDPAKRLAYLRTTVVNLAHSAHRRRATAARHAVVPSVSLGEGTTASAEDAALARSGRADVIAALQALPTRQRAAVVLKHWLRMTEGEIAAAMGCSVGSVRTHISRGHESLATRLGRLNEAGQRNGDHS